jgi:hypothetical protein
MTNDQPTPAESGPSRIDNLLREIVSALTREQQMRLMDLLEAAGVAKTLDRGSPDPEFVNTTDMQRETGLSARYVASTLIYRRDFPDPVMSLNQKTRLWLRVDWENWKRRRAGIRKEA